MKFLSFNISIFCIVTSNLNFGGGVVFGKAFDFSSPDKYAFSALRRIHSYLRQYASPGLSRNGKPRGARV